jgi:NADH-quinone oxidoreductase subunit J
MAALAAPDLAFGALALLTLGSAAVVALSPNIIHATLALLGTFLGVAGLYVLLSADFVAAVQVLVYVGGTLTLMLFAVMLTSRIEDVRRSNRSLGRSGAFFAVAIVLVVLVKIAVATPWKAEAHGELASTARIGHALLGRFVFPFEVVSLLLLAALVGAVVIARRAIAPRDAASASASPEDADASAPREEL